MLNEFHPSEKLYRKIRPLVQFWDNERERPTSGAFKDSKGISVDRQGDRQESEAIEQLNHRLPLDGAVVSVQYQECIEIPVTVAYLPVPENIFHSEIHDSETKTPLSSSKARKLSQLVRIEQLPHKKFQ